MGMNWTWEWSLGLIITAHHLYAFLTDVIGGCVAAEQHKKHGFTKLPSNIKMGCEEPHPWFFFERLWSILLDEFCQSNPWSLQTECLWIRNSGQNPCNGPGQFFGSYVINQMRTIRSVQWLSWVFATQERRIERMKAWRKKETLHKSLQQER